MSRRWMNKLMFLLCIAAFAVTGAIASAQTDSENEAEFWDYALSTNTQAAFQLFVETYPDSSLVPEAQDRLEALRENEEALKLESQIFDILGQVTWDEVLRFGEHGIQGQRLADVANLSPAFPPIEGLPEEFWKDQTCANCHAWTRETLCEQSQVYIDQDPTRYRNKSHPFGGSLKVNMRNWAMGGCP